MRNLYLLRHGEAGSHFATGDDSQRPLTPEGMEKMGRQAQTLVRWKLHVDLILSSPYTRARQTAQIVADALGVPLREDARIASMAFTPKALAAILADHTDAKALLLAGHEPDFSRVLSQVVGGGKFDFAKGGLSRVALTDSKPPSGTLEWFLAPETML